jgi:hypothetical protein
MNSGFDEEVMKLELYQKIEKSARVGCRNETSIRVNYLPENP